MASAIVTKAVSAVTLHGFLTDRLQMPTRTAAPDPTAPSPVIRAERCRVRFDSPAQAVRCAQIAGACRYQWNHVLADCERRYRLWKAYRIGPKPSVSFFTLDQRLTALRNDPDYAWLKALPYAAVRYTLKYLAEAYKRFLADPANEGKPRFKSRHRTTPGFTLPDHVRLDGTRLYIPKVGWVRLAGNQGRYLGCPAKQVRLRKEGDERHPQWHVHVFHEVPADRGPVGADDGALGLSRVAGQATHRDGRVYAVPGTSKLEANIKRKERKVAKARERSRKSGRAAGQPPAGGHGPHRGRRGPEHQGHDQEYRGHGGGTGPERPAEGRPHPRDPEVPLGAPGTPAGLHVADLCGLWSCRPGESQDTGMVQCMACGHTANADPNAAINILARGLTLARPARGVGASARRGAFPSGTPTTCAPGRPGISVPARAGPFSPVPRVNSSV